ncbi:MAG: leader peptidase (prepilin peptidase)/N-methyltransferase [Oceanospirillaceae bacterium]
MAILLSIFSDKPMDKPIPFGPYLTIAGFISLLWGPQLTQLYLNTLL